MKALTFYDKETPYPLGFVADFCPIERVITVERVDAIHASRYLSFLKIDRGPLLRRDRTCCSCGITIPDERHVYAALASAPEEDVAALEEKTNPGVTDRYHDLIALSFEIENGEEVDPETKTELLKEQFAWLERIAAQHWAGETKLDRFSVMVGLASLALWFASLVIVTKTVPEASRLDAIGWVFGAGLLLFIVNAIVFFLAPRRALRKHVLPLIAKALRPLRPSPEELDDLLAAMHAEGFRYATKIKRDELLKLLHRPVRAG
jgi:hypothetical protein